MNNKITQQSNPFSTGGGGGTFETRVQAAFTVLMLTGRVAPCMPSWPITKIKLQGKYAGFNTDDCIVYVQDSKTGKEGKLIAQIKHSVGITEGDQVFAKSILAAWKDFNDASIFSDGLDAIALITGPLSSTDINNVRPLLDWARHCEDETEFISKVNTAHFSSDTKREKLGVFKAHLKSANSGVDVTDKVLWQFLKSFNLIGYDLDSESSGTVSLLQSLISQYSSAQQHSDIWSQIVTYIQGADQSAGTITFNTIPVNIRSRFNTSLNQSWRVDLQKLYDHSDYILQDIRTDIAGVHIKRDDLLYQLLNIAESSSFVLLSGGRGCGKSSIVREIATLIKNHHPVFCLRTEDLNESHLDRAFSAMGIQGSLSDLSSGFAMMPKRFLLLESLEKLLELQNTGAFRDLINFLKAQPGWTVIASGRDYAYQQITINYLQLSGVSWTSLIIPEFSSDDTEVLCNQIETLKPLKANDTIRKLIKNPFIADLAARVTATGTQFSESDGETVFREAVWRDVISKEQERIHGLPEKRKRAFINIAVKRAKQMSYGVSGKEFNPDALLKLEEDNLIVRDPAKGLVSPAHDVLEDWALEVFIEEAFQQNAGNVANFLEAIGSEPAMNRAFRLWLHQRLRSEHAIGDTTDLILAVLRDTTLQTYWKDEAISAVLMGDNPFDFLENLRDQLFENNGGLLKRFCFILRISCKAPDNDLVRQITGTDDKLNKATGSLFLRPYGRGWEAVILFLYKNKTCITENILPHLAAVLDEWASLIHIEKEVPLPACEAGLIALYLLGLVKDSYRDDDNRMKLLGVIIKVIPAITTEFRLMFEQDIFRKSSISDDRRPGYIRQLLPRVLVGIETIFLCKHTPDLIIKLAWQEWLIHESDQENPWESRRDVKDCFGLHEYSEGSNFSPASGAKGPFVHLLRYHPRKGLDFIIGLCNQTAKRYAASTLDSQEKESLFPTGVTEGIFTVEIPLADGTCIKQYCSHRLWCGYRGTAVLPYLLQSALMALENWLIAIAEHTNSSDTLEWVIDHILRNSNSVMPTAVIASVATGFPEKMGKAALPLLRTPDLYHWDMTRCIHESHALGAGFSNDPMWKLYAEERKTANNRPWRKELLETLVTRLQFTELRDEIFKLIDEFRSNIPKSDIDGKVDERWRFRLHRIDIRGWEPREDKENKRILFQPKNLEPELKEIQEKTQAEQTLNNRFMSLFLWSEHTFKGEPLEREYYTEWREALQEAKLLIELLKSGEVSELARMEAGGIIKAAAIFLRDYSTKLSPEDVDWCRELVIEAVLTNADTDNTILAADRTGSDGATAAARVLPILFDFTEDQEEKNGLRHILAVAITHKNTAVRDAAAEGIRDHLWQRESEFAQTCINGALEYARLRMEEIQARRSSRWERASKTSETENKLQHLRERIVSGKIIDDPSRISFESHSAWYLLAPVLMVPDGSTKQEHTALLSRMLLLLIEVEESRKQNRHGEGERIQVPHELATDFSKRFADYLLSISQTDAQGFIEIFIERCESAPDFFYWLLVCLLYSAEKRGNIELYWQFWKKLAKKVGEVAVDLSKKNSRNLRYDDRRKLILGMLFADTPWQQVKTEEQLLVSGKLLLLDFVDKTAQNPLVFEAMSRFLYYFPQLFISEGLTILSEHQKNIGGIQLFSGTNTVFYMEQVLRRILLLDNATGHLSAKLHQACKILLDAMVETGSSTAYFLREHLVKIRFKVTGMFNE